MQEKRNRIKKKLIELQIQRMYNRITCSNKKELRGQKTLLRGKKEKRMKALVLMLNQRKLNRASTTTDHGGNRSTNV